MLQAAEIHAQINTSLTRNVGILIYDVGVSILLLSGVIRPSIPIKPRARRYALTRL